MIARRLLVGFGFAVVCLSDAASAGPWTLFQPQRSQSSETRLRIRPWRADSSAPVFRSAVIETYNTIGEGGEIILAADATFRPAAGRGPLNGGSLTISPGPRPVAPSPSASVSPIPTFQPLVLGSFGQSPPNRPDKVGPTLPTASSVQVATYDALINFGDGPFPSAASLTDGAPRPWYQSDVVSAAFGHTPSSSERSAFTREVLSVVRDTYLDAGLDISLSTDPDADAAHTLSVVSNAAFPANERAIGIADLGGDGFSFIDKFGPADTLDKLQVALGKNIAHELMHTFGVDHLDTSGDYLDSASNSWDELFDRSTGFGAAAVAELASSDFQKRYDTLSLGAQTVQGPVAQTVPEPAAVALWAIGVAGLAGWTQIRRRRALKPTR